MQGLSELAQMHTEWEAWQDVVREFRCLGIDLNEKYNTPLVKAICVWGEQLYRLRREQEPELVDKALADYKAQYETAKAEDVA